MKLAIRVADDILPADAILYFTQEGFNCNKMSFLLNSYYYYGMYDDKGIPTFIISTHILEMRRVIYENEYILVGNKEHLYRYIKQDDFFFI